MAPVAANGQHITEAFIGDIHGTYTLALQHRIGRHGGTVYHLQAIGRQSKFRHALQYGLLRRLRRGQHLVDAQRLTVIQDEVGKGAAGIDTEPFAGLCGTRCIHNGP